MTESDVSFKGVDLGDSGLHKDKKESVVQKLRKKTDKLFHSRNDDPEKEVKKAGTVGRKRFLKTMAVTSVAAGAAILTYSKIKESKLPPVVWVLNSGSKELKDSYNQEQVEKEEVMLLYLLNGTDSGSDYNGIFIFAKDLANKSNSSNKDSLNPVNIYDIKTWGHSELTNFFQAFDVLFKDLLTKNGRARIKGLVEKHEPRLKSDYFAQVGKLERYISDKDSVNEQTLVDFFKATKESGGLGYSDSDISFLFDCLKAYRNGSFTMDLGQKVNILNEKNGSSFRIKN